MRTISEEGRKAMKQITDIRVLQAQNGDVSAFESLVREYQSRLYHTCLRMMADPEDARDMAQDILVKVWRSLPSFKGESSFSTWLYRIAVNTCLDELRRRKKAAHASVEALAESGWEPSDPEAEHLLELALNRDLLQKALQRLPDDFRTVIVLRDVNGLSYEEIAQIIDCPIGTVRSRLNRARKNMAKILIDMEPNFLELV